jgi:hypothetical protein
MSGRVAMVPLDPARQPGAEIGLPAPMTTRSAGRAPANNRPRKHILARQAECVAARGSRPMFSILLQNLRIPVEDGVMVWPPDGVRPASAAGG